MKRYRYLFAILISAICTSAIAGSIEEKWGLPLNSPIGLKQLVVQTLYVKSQKDFDEQKGNVSKPISKLLDNIDATTLLYAFDSLGSSRDIADLATLSSYYLGESTGVLYRCLVLRKGEKILPALHELASSSKNDCIEHFGATAPICRTDQEYRSTLHYYVDTITKLSKTHSTEPGCTTAGWANM